MRDDRPYLADILQAIERVEEIGRRGRVAFLADWLLQDAEYFRVDLEIVWALIERRVAGLRGDLARLAASLDAPR